MTRTLALLLLCAGIAQGQDKKEPASTLAGSSTGPFYNTVKPSTVWATLKSSTGKFNDAKERTLTIELQKGVLCTVVTPPTRGYYFEAPQSFTLTCIKPSDEEAK